MAWSIPKADPTVAWAAGLFDGEGCISIGRTRNAKAVGRPAQCRLFYIPRLLVRMTSVGSLRHFQRAFHAGTISGPELNPRHITYRPVYTWSIRTRDGIQTILMAMLPYLTVKRREALLMLQFLRISIPRDETSRYSVQQQRQREKLYWRLRAAKKDYDGQREADPLA